MAYTTKTVLSESDVATRTTLGVVKIGRGIDITPDGVISAIGKVITSAGITTDGNLILIYNDGTELNAGDVPDVSFGTILVSDDYGCTNDDCYIGVDSDRSITITLPVYPGDGHQIVIKLEMSSMELNQTITIDTRDNSTIDGALSYTMTEPWQSLHLFSRAGDWFIV